MAYLAATELVFPAGVSIGASTSPFNVGQTASLIFEFEGEIDGYVAAAGYLVPITPDATYAFATLRRATKNGVSAVMLDTIFNRDGTQKDASTASSYQRAYDAFKKGLKDGSLILVGAPSAGEAEGLVLPRAGGIASPIISIDTCF